MLFPTSGFVHASYKATGSNNADAVLKEAISSESAGVIKASIVVITAAVPGPEDIVVAGIAATKIGQAVAKVAGKTFQTYTKTNKKTKEVYSGKTSGTKDPDTNVANRDANHHKNADGFGKAQLDKSSSNSDAIRGREQQLIDANGGAKSQGGTSGNAINGVADSNPNKETYVKACNGEFC